MNLVVGATGFIGQRLCHAFARDGESFRALARSAETGTDMIVADLSDAASLAAACTGVRRVFHCAGYAHAFSSQNDADATRHWQVNFEGARNMALAAAKAGVETFVFLSSVKAMAEPGDCCVNEDWPGEPITAYGKAKRAAEEAIREIGDQFGMDVVILRLSMVYGAGSRGNLERMARLVARRLFPPLPETGNHRSLVHVSDVVDAMRAVADTPKAAGNVYIVAGPEAPSGRQLFDALRAAQGLPVCRWQVPHPVMRMAALVGDGMEHLVQRRLPIDSEVLQRLLGSAWYSPERLALELGWRAKIRVVDGIRESCGT